MNSKIPLESLKHGGPFKWDHKTSNYIHINLYNSIYYRTL